MGCPRPIRSEDTERGREHDACGILASIRKTGQATHGNVKRTLEALNKMSHRSGEVLGEGDGCGILTDIPRKLWVERLNREGLDGEAARDPRFVVAHLMIPRGHMDREDTIIASLRRRLQEGGVQVLTSARARVNSGALGRLARQEEPAFWQIAGICRADVPYASINRHLFRLQLQVEAELPVHFASFSRDSVVYKVRGSPDTLMQYFPELRHPSFRSAITIGHNRYSTNTASSFERVQPFSLLGHNGEINTIRKLREEARQLGMQLIPGASDSQDVNRVLEYFILEYGFNLSQALEILFPPIINEVKQFPEHLQDMYMYLRHLWGPFSQGPAAIVSRYGDECVFSVDALGLRPLWLVETEKEYVLSSEKGVIPVDMMLADPKPLAPGEKVAVQLHRDQGVTLYDYPRLQQRIYDGLRDRYPAMVGTRRFIFCGGPAEASWAEAPLLGGEGKWDEETRLRRMAASGWSQEDAKLVKHMASSGNELIGSLGYDGPLAALAPEAQNLSDFFKESVAVVTNPSIDREREIEHFSTRSLLGVRPPFQPAEQAPQHRAELMIPVLLGGLPRTLEAHQLSELRRTAAHLGTYLIEDLVAEFANCAGVAVSPLAFDPREGLYAGLERTAANVIAAVASGNVLIVLDDTSAFGEGSAAMDPHLALAFLDNRLREAGWRRECSLVVRSSAFRNLHDLAMALGLGAQAVNPYMMLEVALEEEGVEGIRRLVEALQKGLEKVISTMGIHELRGYSRIFSSIGLKPELAEIFAVDNFCGSFSGGYGFEELEAKAERRRKIVLELEPGRLARTDHFNPPLWKVAWQVAQGLAPYHRFAEKVEEEEASNPVSLRHLLDFRRVDDSKEIDPWAVDTSITGHAYPILISSMSFGSQGETAFRAYAEAAYRLNILCLNGEGGEIRDMLGRYRYNRGQQIASGRFGVNAELANSANLFEIKIGQGAKPGEGGHLPGTKVSPKVAAARNATPGVDLISPSNNHDIYSIEDLAQLIEELKTINPYARVAVKVPVVPGIGTICVGIAKAGADIINLSGYDGGTGAARIHALKNVGLPAEIGVKEAHRALVEAGLRHRVEIWCDGGMRTAKDVVKMILLGANRVGFGTMAMVALGCTICRGCQLDTCHVGIATQMETQEEAQRKGVKRFEPREFESAVRHLCTFFGALGEEIRYLTASLGFRRTQDMVGRCDLLYQKGLRRAVDLSYLLEPIDYRPPQPNDLAPVTLRRPLSYLTKLVSDMVVEAAENGQPLIEYEDSKATSADRALGTYLSGALVRRRMSQKLPPFREARLKFTLGTVPGNGLACFNVPGVTILVEGGAQDGVGKTSLGGKVVILKSDNFDGQRVDGSVGKSFAYGAQRGLFLVQGDADSRCGIRLSGADIVIGGRLKGRVDDSHGCIASRANIKGFAFEYMTAGRAVVLGDPGPWICSGMTGGVVYLHLQPEMGMDEAALRRRIAKGAKVKLLPVQEVDRDNLEQLLGAYTEELKNSGQDQEAEWVASLLRDWRARFMKVVPQSQQVDPSVSTE
jgi:glutamate synthase (NADPH/NADH) large chain